MATNLFAVGLTIQVCVCGSKYAPGARSLYMYNDVQCVLCFVGGMGPTSDFGWGCMLRCGQMMLAEALIRRHLSRGIAHHAFFQFV